MPPKPIPVGRLIALHEVLLLFSPVQRKDAKRFLKQPRSTISPNMPCATHAASGSISLQALILHEHQYILLTKKE